jgi:hypothetical protein
MKGYYILMHTVPIGKSLTTFTSGEFQFRNELELELEFSSA